MNFLFVKNSILILTWNVICIKYVLVYVCVHICTHGDKVHFLIYFFHHWGDFLSHHFYLSSVYCFETGWCRPGWLEALISVPSSPQSPLDTRQAPYHLSSVPSPLFSILDPHPNCSWLARDKINHQEKITHAAKTVTQLQNINYIFKSELQLQQPLGTKPGRWK